MQERAKVVRLGSSAAGDIFCKIEVRADDGKVRLSISGVEGPKHNGDCLGSAGQIVMSRPEVTEFAPGWNAEKVARFFDLWDKWHLNDMRAGCEHQRAERWEERPIDPEKPLRAYGRHFPGQRSDSWNMLGWVSRSEHPEGLLSLPCPVCGYKYGTVWLHEPVPDDVLAFFGSLPDTDKTPAWV